MAEKSIQDLINVIKKQNKISDKAAKLEKDALDIKIQESKINLEKLNVAKTAKSDAVTAINDQKQVLEAMKESIEAQGGKADENKAGITSTRFQCKAHTNGH